jgi:hypothetical protein
MLVTHTARTAYSLGRFVQKKQRVKWVKPARGTQPYAPLRVGHRNHRRRTAPSVRVWHVTGWCTASRILRALGLSDSSSLDIGHILSVLGLSDDSTLGIGQILIAVMPMTTVAPPDIQHRPVQLTSAGVNEYVVRFT